MNEQIKEQLSALMDGELSADQARFLHRRLQGDAALRDDWARWHLAREALQGRRVVGCGLVERVAAGIEADAVPRTRALPGVLRWAAGAAVAASVAVAALVALPRLAPSPEVTPALAASLAPETPRVQVVDSGLRDSDLRPSLAPVVQSVAAGRGAPLMSAVQVDPRVDGWLLRHNAASLQPLHDSFVPYIPVVSPYRPPHGQIVVESRGGRP
jgi:sigma-E factor negative regulatory protein RseA